MINQNSIFAVIFGIALAALAVRITHRWARENRWEYVPRYVCGGLIVMAAFAPTLYTTLDWTIGSVLLLILGVMFAAAGLMTWLEHDADHQREVGEAVKEAERLNKRIHSEWDK